MSEKPLTRNSCPVCYSGNLFSFIEIQDVPISSNRLWLSREEALHAPRGNINLSFCNSCGHVFNAGFEPDLVEYGKKYENSLSFSNRFRKYMEEQAHYLIDRYDLHGKDTIEIGCGDGTFLRLLCNLGGNRGIGFDPSFDPERNPNGEIENVDIIQDYFSERYAQYQGDLICCRQVLEHIQFPRAFVEGIRLSIDKRRTLVFFEVPNIIFTIKNMGIWDLIYEHCSYFSRESINYLFNFSGFQTIQIEETFENEYLTIEAVSKIDPKATQVEDLDALGRLFDHVSTFEKKFYEKLKIWERRMEKIRKKNQRAVLWGAGSKGVEFLNMLSVEKQIEYVVDINERKQGNFIAGTGQKIVPPLFLKKYCPDIIFVMNRIYLGEIKEIVNEMQLHPDFCCP